jgi:CRISPR-associated protein Cas2
MRRVYVVSYDISAPKRLKRVYKSMRRYGEHVQLSVFLCRLSEKMKKQMLRELSEIIDEDDDQILLFPMGTEKEFEDVNIAALGRSLVLARRSALIC